MLTYIGRRVLYSIPVILIATFFAFWAVRSTFDPTAKVRASKTGARAAEQIRQKLHLHDPIVEQYGRWLGDAAQGNLGDSERTNEAVSSMITRSFGNTLQLIVWGVLLSALIAVALGVYSATHQYSKLDYSFTGLSFVGLAMPAFWFGLIAIQFLAVWPKETFNLNEPIFFSIGLHSGDQSGVNLDYLRHLVLPVLTLTVQSIAEWSRFQRASMLDVMSADYIRTARAKGVSRRGVVLRHGLRNALIPLVTVIALDTGALFGGLIITESIFSIDGMGRLFVQSFQAGDAQVLTAWVVITAVFVVLFNLIADVMYGVLDPRIRLS